jgi:hypothetical protein
VHEGKRPTALKRDLQPLKETYGHRHVCGSKAKKNPKRDLEYREKSPEALKISSYAVACAVAAGSLFFFYLGRSILIFLFFLDSCALPLVPYFSFFLSYRS